MINFVKIAEDEKLSRELKTAATQGMWGFESGYASDGELQVDIVNGTADAQKETRKLGVIMSYPVDREGDEAAHDTIVINSRVIFVPFEGIDVEDSKLATNSATASWSTASYGDRMALNATGYPTLVGAADELVGSYECAEFLKYENGIVFYRILNTAVAVS